MVGHSVSLNKIWALLQLGILWFEAKENSGGFRGGSPGPPFGGIFAKDLCKNG